VSNAVRIGILGDFNPEFRSHHATPDSLQHAARKLDFKVDSEWIPTPSLASPGSEKILESFDGLWATPGSPYKSFAGMLKGIEFARRRDWPFLGTCGGFQYALIEFARNVLGIADADSAENNSGSKNIVIYPVACAVPNRKGGAPKLSGVMPEIRLRPGSYLQSFYGKDKEIVTRRIFLQLRSQPRLRMGHHGSRLPRSRPRRAEAKSAPSSPPPTASSSPHCSSRNYRPLKKIPIP
jgi:CTP synthase (UTP-ammonia lyase)